MSQKKFSPVSEEQTNFHHEDKQFLSYSYASKEEFIREYKKLYQRKKKAKELYILVLTELKEAISDGNIDSLKKLSNFIHYISYVEDQVTLRNYFDYPNNPLKSTNLVILSCKHNNVQVLEYLLDSNSKILNLLSIGILKNTILPDDEDETCHNAFYYAIRSGNVELLVTLINKWSGNYFSVHFKELDEILSRAYEELKLKNVPLSEEMEMFVENKLIDLRFYSDASGQDENVKSYNNIRKRIELVLQNISLLKAEYSKAEKVDEKFLFIAKFILQNIHILKNQLKSTYDRLPWEEIEFCLISFVSSHIKRKEINLFYNVTLNKSKVLNHLEHFAKELKEENIIEGLEIGKYAVLPKANRERVVAEIVSNYPQFRELYRDYRQIRDIHSLEKMSNYIKLALSADPKEREGQLIITRVLQIIGEYLKNTLESPKLSSTTTELLLISLPRKTREVIIDLRNSLSHAYSLSKRTEIEENADVNFFIGVQNDTKRIDNVISNILNKKKIKMVRILLKKITSIESLDEVKEVAGIFSNFKLDEVIAESYKVEEHVKLEKLTKELKNNITDKTDYEKELFNKIDNIINFTETESKNITTDYAVEILSLKIIFSNLNYINVHHNVIRGLKFFVNKILEKIPSQIESHNLKEIAELTLKIFLSASARIIQYDNLDEVLRLTFEIFYIVELGTGDFKWIEELRNKLYEKDSLNPIYKKRKAYHVTEKKSNNQLELKLSELKSILENNALSDKLIENIPFYKRNKKLQAVIEMLVLDIISILGRSEKNLVNNLLFLDDNTPLLLGKCLRNHLAHDNPLVDVLLCDPSTALILNAKKLILENVIKSKKKIGKLVSDNPSKLKNKYDQNLITINNQKKMFVALEEGNIEDLKSYLRKGADIYARRINSSTTLHVAALGPSLEVIKFIIDQKLGVNIKDANGQSPLHFAAARGRKNIMEFFIGEIGVHVDDQDKSGKTPLHIAAQNGHKDAVLILLKNNANTNIKDIAGFSPLHYTIQNNHIDVAKIMLEKEANVDINETMGGFTSLHIAAESGHLRLVNFLLENKANVNARNDKEGIPLHAAALNGHLDVVNALILKGADVNSRVINGCTPLHYAIENGHEKIANILLKYGANVNVVDKTFNNTPLHYAAKYGHEKIVKALLANKANGNTATVEGLTPLHLAVNGGHLKIVAALLEHGVNIYAEDKNNATPLHFASESGHKAVAELLIENGVEINVKTNDGSTPLHVSALKGHKDIIEFLIRNKADLRAQDIKGNTPLHAAAMNGSTDVIDLLIKNKAEVGAITYDGMTPLHTASLIGHKDIITFLIKNKAEVNIRTYCNITPLHLAIIGGHKDIVNLLIKNGAKINVEDVVGRTPLHIAVEGGHKEIVRILLANGANIDVKKNNLTPLLCAIHHRHKDIVEVLIENGASVNAESPLSLAVFIGYRDIVEILLKNKACINVKGPEDITLLHVAAKRGYKEIINALIARGANVDAMTINSTTPLYLASQEGHEEVAEILIANRADVNVENVEGTPLHIAAGRGHVNVVEVLLNNGAEVNVKDNKNRTPLELAVAHGHFQVMKMLLQFKKIDKNAKGNDDWTILHIASQGSNLEMVKCLVDEGSNINAKNAFGSKPIHIAAREGHKDIVKFFFSKGLSVNELSAENQTLLHYAAMKGQLEVVKYLIAQGADINAKDTNGFTPMHIAAKFGYRDIIEVLLKSDAIYNAVNKNFIRPLDMTDNTDIINLLASTEKLFEFVKRNSSSGVENVIRAGAFINARNADTGTSLHYAAWKGYDGVIKILLQNKANPNAVGRKGITPIHYAAKFSHLKIVKDLLSHGAVYNAISEGGKTPSDFTVDKNIISLFMLISESFKKVKEDNTQVINDLNKIKDIDTVKAVMSARNRENNTLIVAAIHNNFSKVDQLKQILQSDVSAQINTAFLLAKQGNYQRSLSIFRTAFERRKEILGPDNPGTLDIQKYIAHILYKQGIYQEALNMLKEIFKKQKEMLGLNDKDTFIYVL